MLSVSALSSYVHCPRQFYVHHVLKEALPPKDVIVLGLIKHSVYESLCKMEESLVLSVTPDTNIHALFRSNLVRALQDSVKKYRYALRQVNVPLVDAFKRCLPAVDFEAHDRSTPIKQLVDKGLFGQELWSELSPKIRPEYSVKSDVLGLRGRIDRLACYPDGVVPVELKSGSPPSEGVWASHRIQAAAYTMLLSEKFNTRVDKAIVHYVDQNIRRELLMNPFLNDWVIEIRDACNAIISSRQPPKGCNREDCTYCQRKM